MATNKAAAPQAEIVETEVTNSASYGRRVDYSGCASITIDPVKGKGVDGGNFNVVIATLEDGQTITLNLSDEQLNAFHNVSEEGVLFLTLINAKVSDGYRTEGWKLLSCARANKASASAFSVRLQTSAVQAGKMDAVISNRNRFTSFDKGEMDIVSMLLRIWFIHLSHRREYVGQVQSLTTLKQKTMEQLLLRLYDGDKMLSCNSLAECLNPWRAKWFNGDNITVEVRIKGVKQTVFIPLFNITDKAAYGDNSNVKEKHLTVARQWVYGKKFRRNLLKHLFAINGTYDMSRAIARAKAGWEHREVQSQVIVIVLLFKNMFNHWLNDTSMLCLMIALSVVLVWITQPIYNLIKR